MKASERKRLIDRILGLTAQEKAEKDCKDEAKGHRKLAEVLADNLVKPELPERPVGYRPVSDLEGELAAAQAYEKEKERLEAVIAQAGEEPAVPRSEEHTSEILSLMRMSYAVLCWKKKTIKPDTNTELVYSA